MRHFYLILLIFSLLVNLVYSEIYINEINFIDNEFIEIYSNEQLNLTNNKIYDKDLSKFNTLSLIQEKNTNFYLIIGSKFADENNLNSLECTIYKTDKTQVTNGGLLSSGENITLELNQSLNLTYTNNNSYIFLTNETLNYNKTLDIYYIQNRSPCSLSPQVNSVNQENQSNICSNYFYINPYKNVFTDKIEYDFKTNATNYSIEYWIENYENEIVKNKRNSTSLSKKSYTPDDYSNIFTIKATLSNENCTLENESQIFFYSKYEEISCPEPIVCSSSSSRSSSSSSSSSIDFPSKSYIKITNKDEILNGSLNLEYEIYKGTTAKRTIYFYLNSDLIHKFELGKYSKIKGKLDFSPILNNTNKILIEGLDLKDEISFYPPELKSFEESLNSSSILQILEFQVINQSITTDSISFIPISTIDNLTANCYVSYIRTKISESQNITKNQKTTLILNITKLEQKEKLDNYPLKLYCKYKKSNLKSFKYYSFDFNYSKFSSNILKDFTGETGIKFLDKKLETLNNTFLSTLSKDNLFSLEENLDKYMFQENKIQVNSVNSEKLIYESTNSKYKTQSFFFIFIGAITIFTMLISRW